MSTYIFGKLTLSKFYTPTKSYTHKTDFPENLKIPNQVPCKLDKSLQVFYTAPVFNSYLTVTEEQVYKLYSTDNKTTITRSKIQPDTLYTFRVTEETPSLRICEICSYDLLWVGKKTTGKLQISKKCEVITPIGRGLVILQNNVHKKKTDVLLWKIDNDKLYFVEINNPVEGVIEVNIDSVRDNFILMSNENIRGVLFDKLDDELIKDCTAIRTKKMKLNAKKVKVYVKEALLGYYIFGLSDTLQVNSLIEACIVEKTETQYLLRYQNYTGFINISNLSLIKNEKSVKGRIIEIKDNHFELSQEQQISLPFDACPESTDSEEIEDTKEDIEDLSDILNLIKKLAENKKYKEVSETYYKYIHTCTDKDNLSLVYINFLQYINDPNLIKEIKKISKFCTDSFLMKVGENSDVLEVVKYCYMKDKSKALYKRYTELCYKNNIKVTDNQFIRDDRFLDVIIDLIYKYEENPRIETEKIVNSKEGWVRYIENESMDYKRVLYRRVVNMKWKVADMKEWYRMWMAYEKDVEGNVEEVRNRAKEYVASIK